MIKAKIMPIITKIFIFIFCILFITGYSKLFDTQNNIIGVIILTALFIFLKNDLGYSVKQAAPLIFCMLLITVIMPHVAAINPYLGIIVNFVSVFLLLILSSHKTDIDNHVPFVMGYIFAQGYDVSGELFSLRVISILIGGALIAALYFMKNRKNTYDVSVIDLFKSLDLHNEKTQWYFKLAFMITLISFLGDILHYQRTIWITLVILSLIRPTNEESVYRMKVRFPATLIGAILFFVVYSYIVPTELHDLLIKATGFVMVFIYVYFPKTIANTFSALLSILLISPPPGLILSVGGAVLLRIISNAIGISVVIISKLAFSKIFSAMKENAAPTQIESGI